MNVVVVLAIPFSRISRSLLLFVSFRAALNSFVSIEVELFCVFLDGEEKEGHGMT